jgi:hypothetical protein
MSAGGDGRVDSALSVLAERSRFDMLSKLEENVAHTDVKSKERIYAVAALRLCHEGWDDFLSRWNSTLTVDSTQNAEKQLATMVKMNQTIRSKLKEAAAICRSVYRTVIGPLPSHLQSGEEIFHELNEEVQRMREDLFINQHGQGAPAGNGVDEYLALGAPPPEDSQEWSANGEQGKILESDFSFRDFLELADFKMSHAAKQIFDLETRRFSEYSGSAIDWELRLKDVTQDLQKQVRRLSRSLQQEKTKSLTTLREQQDEHAGMLMAKDRKFDDMVSRLTEEKEKTKSLLEARIASISGEFDDRLRELSLMFLQKLGDVRDTTEESKHMAARALQMAIIALKERIRADADADSTLKSTEVLHKPAQDEEIVDVHYPWDGADNETLLRLLRGRIQEQEIMTSAQQTFLRARSMEWETSLREVVTRYEEELRRLSEKVSQLEDLLAQSNSATQTKVNELAELKWSHAQYREEVKTWTATTTESHNNRIEMLNGIVADLESKLSEARLETQASNATLEQLRSKQVEVESKLVLEQSRREELESVKTLADAQIQTDGTSRKFTMALDDPSQSRQASARRNSSSAGLGDREDSGGSAPRSALRGNSSRYLRPSKSIRKARDNLEESAHLAPSERSVSAAQSAVGRAQKLGNAFFNEEPAEKKSEELSKPSPLGRPRDLYKQQLQKDGDPFAASQSLTSRRQSKFAVKMEERKTSLIGNTIGENSVAEDLAKQHGITVEKLQELLKPSDSDAKTLLAPTGPDEEVTDEMERALTQREDFTTEFMHRCVNETAFFRLLIKIIMFVEFAASPANQHTMSPFIKKLLLVRPALASQVQSMRDIRNIEALDVTCLNQFLEEHVAQSLLESKQPRPDDRHALAMVSRFTQQVVNLRIERCVQALPPVLMVNYIVGDAPAPVADQTGMWKRRIMKAPDLKILVELALDVMAYMHARANPQNIRKGNFGASVAAERLTREVMGSDIGVSPLNLPNIGLTGSGTASTLPPRKPITVSSFVGDLSRRRRSTRINQNLVDAVDTINDTHEVAYACQEHVRRQSVGPQEAPFVSSPEEDGLPLEQ